MGEPRPAQTLARLFAGLTEHAFNHLGVADPPLVDYVSSLLVRFVHTDTLHRLPASNGRPLTSVLALVTEAEALPDGGATKREYLRHIGDVTLFWTGLFPESLERDPDGWGRHAVLNYTTFGKRSYLRASQFDGRQYEEDAALLARLAHEFELCAVGLREIRRDWEHLAAETPPGARLIQ